MNHRTYGETITCSGCRYWSEMIARSNDYGSVSAMCLAPDGRHKGKYTVGYQHCPAWASGHLGAVDEPGQDPTAYQGEAA